MANAQNLTLDSCLQLAQHNNPVMRKAQLGVKRAEQVKMQTVTHYFPQIQGTAFGYHALHPLVEIGLEDLDIEKPTIGNAAVRDVITTLFSNYGTAWDLDWKLSMLQNGYIAGVTAVQPVFMGGKIIAGNRLAEVGVQAARLQADITQREQLEQIEETYWLVYGLQLKQTIVDDATLLLDTLYESVQAAVEAGLALPADQSQVQIRRDEVARQQLQLTNGIRLARQALALSIGIEDSDSLKVAEHQVATDSLLMPAYEIAVTEEERMLALQVKAATLERNMALADALPQIAVGANYSYGHTQMNLLKDGLGGKKGNGALFLTVNVPLTGWWKTGHKIREKQYAVEQARIDEEYIGSQLVLRNRQAYDRMVEAAAMVQLQARTVSHAKEAYEQTRSHYEAGLMTITDVLQAQTMLSKAQSDLTDAQIAYRVQTRRYKNLTGQ